MQRRSRITQIGTSVKAAVENIIGPANVPRTSPYYTAPKKRGPKKLDDWLTFKAQAQTLAIAAMLNRSASDVLDLAIGLFHAQLNNIKKGAALQESLRKDASQNVPPRLDTNS